MSNGLNGEMLSLLGKFGLTDYVVNVETTDDRIGQSEYGVVHEVRLSTCKPKFTILGGGVILV